ncbi:hypothetical protein NBRC116600_26900 [Thalassotalea sp. SU-HH00458]
MADSICIAFLYKPLSKASLASVNKACADLSGTLSNSVSSDEEQPIKVNMSTKKIVLIISLSIDLGITTL